MGDHRGIVADAELCRPLEGVKILKCGPRYSPNKVACYSDAMGIWGFPDFEVGETVTFEKKGFVSKTYEFGQLPAVVRLLEDKLIGYKEKLWFLPGEEVSVYVHSPQQFSAKLYRHGFCKALVLDLGVHEPFGQNVPDGYFVESGPNWLETFRYRIPLNSMPGIYSLLLESQSQEDFAIPLVVSTPKERYGKDSKLLVLASTNTWQCYNVWGGRNRYRNFEDGRTEAFHAISSAPSRVMKGKEFVRNLIRKFAPRRLKAVLVRFKKLDESKGDDPLGWCFRKLSIKRPFTNCALERRTAFEPFTNHLAAGEWRLLAWLEREQISYDIVSGYELHRSPRLLENYDAIILSTHCEYWTREMYEGLRLCHEERGLWVLNISGNTMYREVEFLDDGSIKLASFSFSQSCADETQILGVRYSPKENYGSCAPFKILIPGHWIFEDVPVVRNGYFGTMSLNQNTNVDMSTYDPGRPSGSLLKGLGASGWEVDSLSSTAPKDIKVIAKGINKHGGADMVVREPFGSRGGMFSASSLVFSGCLLIDNIASLMVKNAISRALNKEASKSSQL